MPKGYDVRKRPESVRYFWLAKGQTNLHSGMSLGGLQAAIRRDGPLDIVILADAVSGKTRQVKVPVEKFMDIWQAHYVNSAFNYFAWEDDYLKSTTGE